MSKTDYRVEIEKRAEKSLNKLQQTVRFRILEAISDLGANPRPRGWEKLDDKACWIWVGRRYRVIYEIDEKQKIDLVTGAGSREGIY